MKWWVVMAAALCGCFGALVVSAEPLPQSAPTPPQSQADPSRPKKPAAQATASSSKPRSKASHPGKTQTGTAPAGNKPASGAGTHHPASTRKHRTISPRVQRMRQAFVASASLRPMAQQLLQDRSLPAYTGVEAYARSHAKEDAGALAWLVVGYAHVLDRDYGKAIDPLNRAKVHAGDLGDYVAYYLGTSYLQTGRTAEAVSNLADFAKAHPDSLLVRDAAVNYADALLLEGQAAEAVTLLEPIRLPLRSDLQFALGRAYAASGQTAKAAETLGNIYYTMPASGEADAAYAELKKLPSALPPTVAQRKMRADALMNRKRYSEAADEYRSLVNAASARWVLAARYCSARPRSLSTSVWSWPAGAAITFLTVLARDRLTAALTVVVAANA